MHEFEVFFDGDCPLCSREIKLLKKFDKQQKVLFTDISQPDFKAENYGFDQEFFMAEIRGRTKKSTFVSGVEVFRQLYSALGWNALVQISRWPIISSSLDLGYKVFAKNRLRLTGRCNLQGKCRG